jgi:probable F420-dependent oxidoreductase
MKLDTVVHTGSLREIPALAKAAEDVGFDALWTVEASHNPFLPLALAAEHTERIKLGTAIAVAFPRSPMVLAQIAWDLQALSDGRLLLGLGTQVKGHNERRFSMKWEAPAEKLREVIRSLRAIWDCWQNGTKLNFSGRFYNFTLMTPFFNPGPIAHPKIPIYIAAVNKNMCQLAGELCDGIHIHPLHSVKYIKEFVLPNLEVGAQRSGRSPAEVQRVTSAFVITGQDADEIAAYRELVRAHIAFYASTRTYKVVLDAHGWGEISQRLHAKSVRGEWGDIPKEITDEMLDVFAVTGTYDEIAQKVRARYDGLLDRVALSLPFDPQQVAWKTITKNFDS